MSYLGPEYADRKEDWAPKSEGNSAPVSEVKVYMGGTTTSSMDAEIFDQSVEKAEEIFGVKAKTRIRQ